MLSDCPFLETNRKRRWLPRYGCSMGVNFYSVGPRRELCRTCPIVDWGQTLLCEHLDVYTFLEINARGQQSVEVQMECCRAKDKLADRERCSICPEIHSVGPKDVSGLVILRDTRV